MRALLLAAFFLFGLSSPRPATDPAPVSAVPMGYEMGDVPAPAGRSRTPATPPGSLPPSSPGTRPATAGDAPRPQPLEGLASWYPASGYVAAAGPALRRELGPEWRGSSVTVCGKAGNHPARCVTVRLTDWCRCPRVLVDLSDDAFARLAPLSKGLVRVRVMGAIGLPETDTE